MIKKYLKEQYGLNDELILLSEKIEANLKDKFKEIDNICEYNQYKIIKAFQKNKISEVHFNSTTGYGYNDIGREKIEDVYSDVFSTESTLIRGQVTCGTHALAIALFGNLRPGDELLCPAGKPYDTLESVIGIRESKGSLLEYGVIYKQVDLKEDYSFDYEGIKKAITEKTKLVEIQRSRGYDVRPSFTVEQIKDLIVFIKGINPNIICMVDNCYGEFVENLEPSNVGADLIVGSLIKNPGGGLAPIGGYVTGKKEYVDNASYRLTCPGLGKEVGASLGLNRVFLQGLFFAPTVVAASLKGAVFSAAIMENLGYEVSPKAIDYRTDIVQQIKLNSPENVIAFCQGIQKGSPIDSHVLPEPWDMPGYDDPVIMAAGAFIGGSSIELSADAPIRKPYTVYMQGGLNYPHAKLGTLIAIQEMINKGLIDIS